MENQTIHGNPSCDISDPDSCSGGHSVSKEDRKTEPVSQITQIDESDDGEEEDGPHISLNANTSEKLGQNKTRGNAKSPGLRHFWLMREHLLLSNNCLFYRWKYPDEIKKLYKVSDAIKGEITGIAHCLPLSGHPGIKRTTQRL